MWERGLHPMFRHSPRACLLLALLAASLLQPPVASRASASPLAGPALAFTAVDTMKESRDTETRPLGDAQIASDVGLSAGLHPSHITVDTHWDYPDYMRRWVGAVRAAGRQVWFRIHPNQWGNNNGTSGIMTPAAYEASERAFLRANPDLFRPGDILDPCPEPENGLYWQASYGHGWTGNAPNPVTREYNAFIRATSEIADQVLHEAGIYGVITTVRSTNSFFAGHPGALEAETVARMGRVTVDSYPEGTSTDPATAAAARAGELSGIAAIWGVPVVIGEMGYSVKLPVDDATQEAVLRAELTALGTLPFLSGVNYWVGAGTDNSGGYTHLFAGGTGSWTPRPAALALADFYARYGPPLPDPQPSPTTTPSAIATGTPSATATATPSPSNTATGTASSTPSPRPTLVPSSTAAAAPASATRSPSATPSATPRSTGTATNAPSAIAPETSTAISTPSASLTASASATPTRTAVPSATSTASLSPTRTLIAAATATPTASRTASPTATRPPSATPSPTASASPTATASPSASGTATPPPTATWTMTRTPTASASASPTTTSSATATPSLARTAGPPAAPTETGTASPTPTVATITCPAGWNCADIGAPVLGGGQTIRGSLWTVTGSGWDIWSRSAQYHYVYRPLTGDSSLSARVLGQTRDPSLGQGRADGECGHRPSGRELRGARHARTRGDRAVPSGVRGAGVAHRPGAGPAARVAAHRVRRDDLPR